MLYKRFASALFFKLPFRNQNLISLRFYTAQAVLKQPEISSISLDRIRNIAIIAHVDHGKTTLVDQLLKQSGTLQSVENDRVLDSNDLEKERGITILSKCTTIDYKNHRINIVDTPGHADFGGEVERVLSMVDGVALLICATEGPMTQTKFVLGKALERNLKPIVIMNKIDRPTARPLEVENELLELFITLDANDEQLDYPILYASAKNGWACSDFNQLNKESIVPILDKVIEHVPPPKLKREEPFSMLITQMENDSFVGKCYLGKINSGVLRIGDKLKCLNEENEVVNQGKCTKIFIKRGLEQVSLQEASAGEIVSIAGIEKCSVNQTLCDEGVREHLPFTQIDAPTIAMTFSVNDSPLGGQEGKCLTSQLIRDRLFKEAETNIALQISELSDNAFEVKGRGVLQMGVLIETMRREGFEISVSPPRVIYKFSGPKRETILEPLEEVTIDCDPKFTGTVTQSMSVRKGVMKTYSKVGESDRLVFEITTRALLSYLAEFKNETRGEGTLHHMFMKYIPFEGTGDKARKGSIISLSSGEATTFALKDIEPRGKLFIKPGEKVYPGMIIGEHNRDNDLEVNPVKTKQLTNLRAAGKEDTIKLTPATTLSLEQWMTYIQTDEVIEITPKSIRCRKKELDGNKRKQQKKLNPIDLIRRLG